MLEQIQQRDRTLLGMQNDLEHRVSERTHDLENARDDLLITNLQLDMSGKAAEAANRSKSEFLANMSHEIRTPMTAILGFSDVLLEPETSGSITPVQAEAVQTIKNNGEHLLAIINDILDLSKIESGKMAVETLSCTPRGIVTDIAKLMRIRADAKGLEFVARQEGRTAAGDRQYRSDAPASDSVQPAGQRRQIHRVGSCGIHRSIRTR